jgi:heme/copper-type cytochrome/quinol oxidase subunit 2
MFEGFLAEATFWVAAVACVVAQVAIVRSVLVARAPADGSHAESARVEPSRRTAPRRGVEVAWAVVPALALAAVLVLTWRAMHPAAAASAASAPAAPTPSVAAEV